ncbi:MAG TPA: nitrite reductase (NAD(P)H) [Microscillaceae bacterium]|nr:nitrite reductase (NAD(P)H) [Microscillaceae bacterium]
MEKIVVIGNGMVGYKFCEKLRKADHSRRFSVKVFGEEPRPAYDRVHLSAYFTGTSVEELTMAPRNWYEENDIELITGELITQIDRSKKQVVSHKGTIAAYDKLVIATGSTPFVPPIPGVEKQGVFVYRTIEDLDAIIAYGQTVKSVAVMGGGLLGLEAAKAVLDLGLETHVVEFASRLMPRQLDDQGAAILQAQIAKLGVNVHTHKNTHQILGNGKLEALVFADKERLNIDMLVISAGIRPRDELARGCDLAVGPRGGIVVNERMQTNDASIYAIGEVALFDEMIYGLVAPGYEMAEVVVNQLLQKAESTFAGADMSTKLKLIGVEVASFGDALGTAVHRSIVVEDQLQGIYKRLNVSPDGQSLLGGILVGDAEQYNQLLQIYKNNLALPPHPEDLIIKAKSQENQGFGVESLPAEAQICSCENVSKGTIIAAITEQGAENVAQIKACTQAGVTCGGCSPMLADILDATLQSMGKRVRKTLCEHFDYTRQELFDLVKVQGIRTFDELLDTYGAGDGCETCKPAVASILASAWNDMILDKSMTIQDTNDRFLANIQRGGTYSVVPRVPAGEITPDKLIVLGTVAQKYNLYIKITGGQRIDLFGARVDQLPDIWEELIQAGFESGHAYGKALRTVKSCVGSSWCRFGVQDSVSFAIEVEQRYRGLRAPHKLKGAVSGCIRECAEAQSKDFGIIATEKGWNLYVGGNGGSKPQHAQLLANDVDSETCIRYIDRYLMFYIKTAEPLTRTAPWLNKLDGGLEYLKDVVVNDCLGIGAQLEKEMQLLVEAYSCEWKEVVNNPALRARFKHFVNSDDSDDTLQFDQQRGQKVPAAWGK